KKKRRYISHYGDRTEKIRNSLPAANDRRHPVHIPRLANDILLHNGFEPSISLTVLADRTVSCIICLADDRDLPGEDEKATACYRELLEALAREGYHSYRMSVGATGRWKRQRAKVIPTIISCN